MCSPSVGTTRAVDPYGVSGAKNPRLAQWRQVGNETGSGNFNWDEEDINTIPAMVQRSPDLESIEIKRPGQYLVVAALWSSTAAAHSIRVNGTQACREGVADTSVLTAVINARAGDLVACFNTAGNRIGSTNPSTTLTIIPIP